LSSALAFGLPWIARFREDLVNLAVAATVASWSAVICLVLLVIALILYRFRGAWLLIPFAISLYWPSIFFAIISGCARDRTLCP
jgi:hypothetical protein